MEDRSSRRMRILVTHLAPVRGLPANQIACALMSMRARSTCSNQRPDTLMQDRIARIDENLLHRTAGPYIRVKTRRLLCYRNVGFRQLRTFRRLGPPRQWAQAV